MPIKRHQNVVSFSGKSEKLGPVSNTIILIVLACLVGLLYLTQITKTNSYGYQIDKLQKEYTSLRDQKVDLENTTARLQSIDRVQKSQSAQQLVTTAPSVTLQN